MSKRSVKARGWAVASGSPRALLAMQAMQAVRAGIRRAAQLRAPAADAAKAGQRRGMCTSAAPRPPARPRTHARVAPRQGETQCGWKGELPLPFYVTHMLAAPSPSQPEALQTLPSCLLTFCR